MVRRARRRTFGRELATVGRMGEPIRAGALAILALAGSHNFFVVLDAEGPQLERLTHTARPIITSLHLPKGTVGTGAPPYSAPAPETGLARATVAARVRFACRAVEDGARLRAVAAAL